MLANFVQTKYIWQELPPLTRCKATLEGNEEVESSPKKLRIVFHIQFGYKLSIKDMYASE